MLLTESETTTPDGATLKAQVKSRFARDSQGRTRTETPRPRQKNDESIPLDRRARIDNLQGLIVIEDPAGHSQTLMYPNTLVAMVAKRFQTEAPKKASVGLSGKIDDGPVSLVPIVEEYFGVESVDGMRGQHYRVSEEYPIGDDYRCQKPHVVISDYWYSSELRITIVARYFDSRIGLTTTRFTDITRAEPDPALFEVPPEYKIVGDDYTYVFIPTASGTGKFPENCSEFEPPPKELGSPQVP
jgi:hypothetical protein